MLPVNCWDQCCYRMAKGCKRSSKQGIYYLDSCKILHWEAPTAVPSLNYNLYSSLQSSTETVFSCIKSLCSEGFHTPFSSIARAKCPTEQLQHHTVSMRGSGRDSMKRPVAWWLLVFELAKAEQLTPNACTSRSAPSSLCWCCIGKCYWWCPCQSSQTLIGAWLLQLEIQHASKVIT